jgi:endonuclease/exonuclease/phosphatase family metal-dependent hydrolase
LVLAREIELRGNPILVVNVYGKFDVNPSVTVTVHQALDSLSPLLRRFQNVILGGDMNISIEYGRKHGSSDARVLGRIQTEFGLRDCTKPFGEKEIRTQKREHYQVDYVFASRNLADKVICRVLQEDCVPSDHCPVLA